MCGQFAIGIKALRLLTRKIPSMSAFSTEAACSGEIFLAKPTKSFLAVIFF